MRGVRIGSSSGSDDALDHDRRRAQLTGRTVELDAAVVGINLTARASAEAYCPIFCIATAYADAHVDLYSQDARAGARRHAGTTTITGIEGVDLKARHVDTVSGTAPA